MKHGRPPRRPNRRRARKAWAVLRWGAERPYSGGLERFIRENVHVWSTYSPPTEDDFHNFLRAALLQ